MAQNQAQIPDSSWHTVSLRIPFRTQDHAVIAHRALDVDREQNGSLVHREMKVEGDTLIINYAAATIRLLRLSTNSFLSSADLVLRTMSSFAPDPSDRIPTDEELEEIRREANKQTGAGRGIELRGDGKGAGSGEEVR
ncbi:hypothetical protein IAT38_005409 [Cryptococcus sp. DSM 104549]